MQRRLYELMILMKAADDRLVTTHRGLHDLIGKGVPLVEVYGEMLGREMQEAAHRHADGGTEASRLGDRGIEDPVCAVAGGEALGRSILDEDPCLVLETIRLQGQRGPVPLEQRFRFPSPGYVPNPGATALEAQVYPSVDRIAAAVRRTLEKATADGSRDV